LSFDASNWHVKINGYVVRLRRREAALLESLLRGAGQPIRRETLLSDVYGLENKIDSNALDIHIYHLRQLLIETRARVRINTVRFFGYALQCDENPRSKSIK
jgi:DNA-binding response OmpR family regulator